MPKISRIGIDLSKSVFVLYGVDENEQCCLKRTLKRIEVLTFFATLEPCQIAMEAGSGAHYWARELIKQGHDTKIIDPELVAPYRHRGRGSKNDTNDSEAVCEAMIRAQMRFVPVKDEQQQAALVIHRIRKGLVNEQNRVANRLRGLLAEFGVVIPKGLRTLHRDWPRIRQEKSDWVPGCAWAEFDSLYARRSWFMVRSDLKYVHRRRDAKSLWAHRLREEKSWNKSAVALANKHARMIWATLAKEIAND